MKAVTRVVPLLASLASGSPDSRWPALTACSPPAEGGAARPPPAPAPAPSAGSIGARAPTVYAVAAVLPGGRRAAPLGVPIGAQVVAVGDVRHPAAGAAAPRARSWTLSSWTPAGRPSPAPSVSPPPQDSSLVRCPLPDRSSATTPLLIRFLLEELPAGISVISRCTPLFARPGQPGRAALHTRLLSGTNHVRLTRPAGSVSYGNHVLTEKRGGTRSARREDCSSSRSRSPVHGHGHTWRTRLCPGAHPVRLGCAARYHPRMTTARYDAFADWDHDWVGEDATRDYTCVATVDALSVPAALGRVLDLASRYRTPLPDSPIVGATVLGIDLSAALARQGGRRWSNGRPAAVPVSRGNAQDTAWWDGTPFDGADATWG